MKVLTAAEMREVDRLTVEAGIPSIVLMENAAMRVVEFLEKEFAPLDKQRIVILCGKGNNGGDGLAIARQLLVRFELSALHLALVAPAEDLKGDAAANYKMFLVCGGSAQNEITPEMRNATIILDALLGTGIQGAPSGRSAEWIHEINHGFPLAKIVAVDIPSGVASDSAESAGECVDADYTITFTAPKVGQVLSPNAGHIGKLIVGNIGSPASFLDSVKLSLSEAVDFRHLMAPRPSDSNKGIYGHVLAIAGSPGKSGAAAMTGIAALRAGAGLVTVVSDARCMDAIGSHAPELMVSSIPAEWEAILERKTVVSIGPGLGTEAETIEMVRRLFDDVELPMVVDADALNALAGSGFRGRRALRVLTPHPGEMSRLCGKSTKDVQADRFSIASEFAAQRNVCLVLKGNRTLIAFPDGRVWVNPTGSPAMATGGSGDILTGLISGFLAQFPDDVETAIRAAVYLHGLAGELGAAAIGEKPFLALDLLRFFPQACQAIS